MLSSLHIDQLPLAVLFPGTIILVVASVAVGIRIGTAVHARTGAPESLGSVVGATLGLLAFLLAFTFNMTASRFDQRKQAYIDEINAIETVYLRAGLLGEPEAQDIRALLREYVDIRAAAARDAARLPETIARSGEIQDEVWMRVEAIAAQRELGIGDSLFIQALNQMIDLQGKRVVVGLHFRIPGPIWFGLYGIAVLAMIVVGYQFGQSRQRPYLVVLLLGLAFSSVIFLIADLDRGSAGSVRVNQQMLFELQEKLAGTAGR